MDKVYWKRFVFERRGPRPPPSPDSFSHLPTSSPPTLQGSMLPPEEMSSPIVLSQTAV